MTLVLLSDCVDLKDSVEVFQFSHLYRMTWHDYLISPEFVNHLLPV